jgi:DNA repair exonuclease SbcCD ATPase subunit
MAIAAPKVGIDKAGGEPMDPVEALQAGNGQHLGTDGVGVDKIRDLLFGNQMQDYDRRFSKLEERFHQRFKEIETDTARNLGAFESNSKKQIESLAHQLREETTVRSDADKELDRTLREQNQSLDKRLRALSDQLNQLERDMADRLTQEAQALRDEIKRRNEETQHTLEKMFAELANVKTDRNLLAGLFVEVARCLNQDTGPKNTNAAAGAARGWPPA